MLKLIRTLFHVRAPDTAMASSGGTTDASGRWVIEEPWLGDECSYWNPLQDENGEPLTFESLVDAKNYRVGRSSLRGSRIVQLRPWRLPPDAKPVPPSPRELALREEMREAVKRNWPIEDPPDDDEMARRLGLRP